MKINDLITLINLSIYRAYFFTCYLLAIVFSAICFNLMLNFYKQGHLAQCIAAAFMTFVFYLAAEASDILDEIFSDKIQQLRLLIKKN